MNVSDIEKNITSVGDEVYMISDNGLYIIVYDTKTKCLRIESSPMKIKSFVTSSEK